MYKSEYPCGLTGEIVSTHSLSLEGTVAGAKISVRFKNDPTWHELSRAEHEQIALARQSTPLPEPTGHWGGRRRLKESDEDFFARFPRLQRDTIPYPIIERVK